jgi:hypothetical protein
VGRLSSPASDSGGFLLPDRALLPNHIDDDFHLLFNKLLAILHHLV